MAIRTGEDYIQSLRGRDLKVYLFGELVKEPVDHPMIRPSINAVAETYDLAVREEDLASATSAMTGKKISRFLHIAESAEDLVMQNKMQILSQMGFAGLSPLHQHQTCGLSAVRLSS